MPEDIEHQRQDEQIVEEERGMDPVRKWTFILMATAIVLLAWYLISDRITPFTSQARVHALIVPIAPEVSGTLVSVSVGNNQKVREGQELFRVDPENYELAVRSAKAKLQSARAKLNNAKQDASRLKRIKKQDPGAISERRIESSEASLESAAGQLKNAETNLEHARLNLEKTIVSAPEFGVVTGVSLNKGAFVAAGHPQMTFIAVHNIWIQADFTENNLAYLDPGDEVRIVFDAMPGKVFTGRIKELGYGVAIDSGRPGNLPTIRNNRDWLREAQRFPVLIDFPLPAENGETILRVGSQASVVVLSGDNMLFNALAKFGIWLDSMFTYAY